MVTTKTKEFSEYARNPDIWLLAARRNLAVAEILKDLYRDPTTKERYPDLPAGCFFYAIYFHAALAIENAVKAVLISRDPTIVENGRLNTKKYKGWAKHKLLDPVKCILGSLSDEERRLLVKLEGFVWAGRYAVPVKAHELYDKEKMDIMTTATLEELAILRSLFDRLCQQIKR
jgi:hypothetical protein